ncbi:protein GRAVITROPIC IN THE LIGHT 1-like isoform X2 [Salvia splendens]|uniref:protein GRAVITROPIC IN THE LIGHT 1-like isoform X2 n=1 Tax=Salvia splendens TaxID=180675 RepID=UPI001C277848|nr:protein GRAVITROPIC IN THE LIGHT 1-like isoform X2 [Salvia splendens]
MEPARRRSRIAKTFSRVISLKSSSKNRSNHPGFCLFLPQEKLRCCESHQLEKEDAEEAMEECKTRAAMEAFVAKLFATISTAKAAYAELQLAQFPYNGDAIQCADQAVVDQLKALSELKYSYIKKQIDSSPPHVTLMLAEIQEQQSLMKTYEITMKKMRAEIESKEARIASLQQSLRESVESNKSLEKKMNASGSFSVLDGVRFSDVSPRDFILVLHYALRSVRGFVKLLIREMESANWDIDAAADAIQHDVVFKKRDHKAFVFESFVCREIFSGFNDAGFAVQGGESSVRGETPRQRRDFFFDQFRVLRSLVHPKMEFSFSGNLNQRKMVNSGEFPETEFFKAFAEMGRRIWLLHSLSFSFDRRVSLFQVSRNSKFSEVYMESVMDEALTAADGGVRVAFTVVPGFKVGQTVVQSQVYLFPTDSPAES